MGFLQEQHLHAIRNEFGERVAFLFAFRNHQQRWLRAPGAASAEEEQSRAAALSWLRARRGSPLRAAGAGKGPAAASLLGAVVPGPPSRRLSGAAGQAQVETVASAGSWAVEPAVAALVPCGVRWGICK